MSVAEPELPAGWEWCALEDVAEVRLGRQRSPKNHFGPNMVPYVRAANVTWAGLDLSDVKEMQFTPEEVATYALQPGDVLVAEASGSASEVGKPAIWRGEIDTACLQNTLIRVRSEGPLPEYLLLAIRDAALSGAFARAALGVGINHLGRDRLASWRIALPPLAEQERIVARFEDLALAIEQGRASVDVAQRELGRLRAALLHGAFTGSLVTRSIDDAAEELAELLVQREQAWREENEHKRKYRPPLLSHRALDALPENWAAASLDELTDGGRVSAYGVLQPGPDTVGGVPLVRVGDVNRNRVRTDALKRIAPSIAADYERTTLRGGELLMTLVGTVGRTAVVPEALAGANVARAVAVIPLTARVDTRYVAYVLSSPAAQVDLLGASNEVARKTLNLEDVRRFPIPLPPLEEQRAIADMIERSDQFLDRVEASIATAQSESRALIRSLTAAAVSGKLTQRESTDAPACELLDEVGSRRALHPEKRSTKTPTLAAARG